MEAWKIEKIRFWFASKGPRWLFNLVLIPRLMYKAVKYPEKKKKFGELNPDKTFYVIRLAPPATGFLANYNYVLGYMKYAFEKGWIPVIDMENYATLYQESQPYNGTKNVWEYFFEQPYDKKTGKRYTLNEVYHSQNVILGKADVQEMYNDSLNDEVLKWQYEMSNLVPFNDNMKKHIAEVYEKSMPKSGSVLGVPTRGSEQKKRVTGHPVPLNVDEMIPIIKEKCREWNMSSIYVKAEEEETINYLKEHLDNVYYSECERLKNYSVGKDINASIGNKKISKADSLRDYLTDIKILSLCTSIIGTKNNGLITAIIWNGGRYKNAEVIDNGVWK